MITASPVTRPYRVVQWGTGTVGTEMLATIIDHRRDLQLVGVKVYSDDKDGVDAGTLAGREPIGVTATTNVEHLLALGADCVIYTPRTASLDDVCAILASGANVVTTSFLFHPDRIEPRDRERLLAACRQGESSVHGSGLNPGNLSGVLPLALSGMSRTIDKITLQERADWSVYESTSITFDNMRFGQPLTRSAPAQVVSSPSTARSSSKKSGCSRIRWAPTSTRSLCPWTPLPRNRIIRSSITFSEPAPPPDSGGTGSVAAAVRY